MSKLEELDLVSIFNQRLDALPQNSSEDAEMVANKVGEKDITGVSKRFNVIVTSAFEGRYGYLEHLKNGLWLESPDKLKDPRYPHVQIESLYQKYLWDLGLQGFSIANGDILVDIVGKRHLFLKADEAVKVEASLERDSMNIDMWIQLAQAYKLSTVRGTRFSPITQGRIQFVNSGVMERYQEEDYLRDLALDNQLSNNEWLRLRCLVKAANLSQGFISFGNLNNLLLPTIYN